MKTIYLLFGLWLVHRTVYRGSDLFFFVTTHETTFISTHWGFIKKINWPQHGFRILDTHPDKEKSSSFMFSFQCSHVYFCFVPSFQICFMLARHIIASMFDFKYRFFKIWFSAKFRVTLPPLSNFRPWVKLLIFDTVHSQNNRGQVNDSTELNNCPSH